ncbi:MAG: transposase [Gammaproteobacteria bacterium]|jgi:transposase
MRIKKSRRTFSSEFRLESAQLVGDENYRVREAATAVVVGHSTMDKWVRPLRKARQGVTPTQSAMTPNTGASKNVRRSAAE